MICVFLPIVLTVFLILFLQLSPRIEGFTAPGLTLLRPPNWFPENTARPYNKKDWQTKMYLQKYPIYYRGKYLSPLESNQIASTYRLWKM